MKNHFYKILLIASLIHLLLISCEKSEKIETTLIRVSYTPAFHNPAEIIIDLKSKTLMLFSPYKISLEAQAPYFDKKENKYLSEIPQIEPFISEITEVEAKEIQDLILKPNNSQKEGEEILFDGITVNTVIFYSDKSINEIEVQAPSEKHSLYKKLIQLTLMKNKSKNNTIILNEIEDYF